MEIQKVQQRQSLPPALGAAEIGHSTPATLSAGSAVIKKNKNKI